MTERVVRVGAAVLVAAYAECWLWYIPVDKISFTGELGMAMGVPLVSRANVREPLDILEVIESTLFDLLPTGWRNRTNSAVDHHLGRCGERGDFFSYYPFPCRKIDEVTAQCQLSPTRIIPDYVPTGWGYD